MIKIKNLNEKELIKVCGGYSKSVAHKSNMEIVRKCFLSFLQNCK